MPSINNGPIISLVSAEQNRQAVGVHRPLQANVVFILNMPTVCFRDTESKQIAGVGGVAKLSQKTVVPVHVFPVD